MLGGVTGRRDRFEGQAPEIERLAAIESTVREGEVRGAGADHGRPDGRQFAAARDEVGVEVRLHRVGDRQPAILCRLAET